MKILNKKVDDFLRELELVLDVNFDLLHKHREFGVRRLATQLIIEQNYEIYKNIGKLYKQYEGQKEVEYYNKALDDVSTILFSKEEIETSKSNN